MFFLRVFVDCLFGEKYKGSLSSDVKCKIAMRRYLHCNTINSAVFVVRSQLSKASNLVVVVSSSEVSFKAKYTQHLF